MVLKLYQVNKDQENSNSQCVIFGYCDLAPESQVQPPCLQGLEAGKDICQQLWCFILYVTSQIACCNTT